MWLTDAATAARTKADQAALSHGASVSETQRAMVAQVFASLRDASEFTALLALHGLPALTVEASATTGRSGTSEGVSVLSLVVHRGCVARLLREADVVNWLARHAPAHLRNLQHVLEFESLPQADNYRRRKPDKAGPDC
jgi:hypothetical protein